MNSDRIHEIFNIVGKLIYLDQQGAVYASGVKAAVVAVQEQNAAADNAADPYAELQSFIGPALNSIRPVTQALDRLSLIVRAGVDNYIRAVAPELNQSAAAAPATIANAIKIAMTNAGEDVAPSGTLYSYFLNAYGIQLPQADPPSIADDIIRITIV